MQTYIHIYIYIYILVWGGVSRSMRAKVLRGRPPFEASVGAEMKRAEFVACLKARADILFVLGTQTNHSNIRTWHTTKVT